MTKLRTCRQRSICLQHSFFSISTHSSWLTLNTSIQVYASRDWILLSIQINSGFGVDWRILRFMSEFISLIWNILQSQQWLTLKSKSWKSNSVTSQICPSGCWRSEVWQLSQCSLSNTHFSEVKFKTGYGCIRSCHWGPEWETLDLRWRHITAGCLTPSVWL